MENIRHTPGPKLPLPPPIITTEALTKAKASNKKDDPPFTIIIDTREQTPLAFDKQYPTIRTGLETGDYSILGHEHTFTIERKSLADLVGTIIHDRERFKRELERMRGYEFKRVLVTAPFEVVKYGPYKHSLANPKSVIASIASFEVRYGVPFAFARTPQEASERVIDWVRMFVRNRFYQTRLHVEKERMMREASTPSPALGPFPPSHRLHPVDGDEALFAIPPLKMSKNVPRCIPSEYADIKSSKNEESEESTPLKNGEMLSHAKFEKCEKCIPLKKGNERSR